MNARLVRRWNHCQTQGTHMFTKKILAEQWNKNNKSINARWVRRGNHCQTQGIHMFTTQLVQKP